MWNNNVYSRLKLVLAKKKLSNSDMARILGISRQLFTDWQKKNKPGIWNILDKILYEFPDIRREWLYAGSEPMLHNSEQRLLSSQLFLLFDAIYPLQINSLIKHLLTSDLDSFNSTQDISTKVKHNVHMLNMSIIILSKITKQISSYDKELRIIGSHVANFESLLNHLHYSFCQMVKLISTENIEKFQKALADVAVHFDFCFIRNLSKVPYQEQSEHGN